MSKNIRQGIHRNSRAASWFLVCILGAACDGTGWLSQSVCAAETKRPELPEPFTLTLEAKRPVLPEPFTLTLEAKRPELPEPFTLTLEAKRPELPEPFTLTLEAKRPELPEPFTLTLEAKRPELPEPFTLTLEAKRPELPEPFTLTLEAKRPELPEPFTLTLEAKRPDPCEQPEKDLAKARSLTDKGSLAAAEQALNNIKAEQCPDVGPKIEAERTRVSGLIDDAVSNAKAALDACKLKESRDLIATLPEGERRQGLVDRWNHAYEIERKARDLVKEAVALKGQDPKKAIGKLHQARDLDPCDSTVAAIDKAISAIENRIAEAAAGKAEAALNACKFRDSRQMIRDLPEGPRRDALVARWNSAYETERKARDLVKVAMILKEQGEFGQAIGKLHQASDLNPCDGTVAAIDKAISNIKSTDANAQCEKDPKFGPGYYAANFQADGSFYCLPTPATANAQCVELNGSGYYAVNIQGDGSFGCLPTKATANGWCVNNNGGGWYAGAIKSDGSFNCNMGKSARNASCQQQYGRGAYAGKVRSDGTFMCYGRRQAQPRSVPRGPSAAEVGAAIAGAIAEGIAASQRGRGGGGAGGQRPRPQPTPPPASRGSCTKGNTLVGQGCVQ